MRQAHGEIRLTTQGKGLYNLTREIEVWVGKQEMQTGMLTVFVQHTSAGLTIQENADPDVRRDLTEFFERLVPEKAGWYRHTLEGPDDMPAHIRSVLSGASLSIPVRRARPALGTWQAVYLFEHRRAPEARTVLLGMVGE